MKRKLEILAEMNKKGFGYCTPEACDEDIMGVGVTWEEILTVSVEDLEGMLE